MRPNPLRPNALRKDRRSTVAVLFAILIIPMLGLTGVAIDYGFWNQANSAIALAASDAALNAVKTAGAADLAKDPAYLTEGQTAGQTWFATNIGAMSNAAHLSNLNATVSMGQTNNIITATVTYSGSVKSIFGAGLFQIGQYPLNVQASASINVAPYAEIQILLDNSNSMQIAGSPLDIADMLLITPCSEPGNANVPNGDTYDGFIYAANGYTYTPPPQTGWWPIILPGTPPVTLTPTGNKSGPSCKGVSKGVQFVNAGTPCAFACHSDNSKPAGSGDDLYAVARSTRGLSPCNQQGSTLGNCQIDLRFDIVKAAVNAVIATMDQDNTAGNNLTVGVSDFNSQLTRDYPTSGEAGNQFTVAETAVGGPPNYPNGPDSGIQPDPFVGRASHSNTDFYDAATKLASQLTPSGNGSTPNSPLKFLFLVTDGLSNVGNLDVGPFDTTRCDLFKHMGYTVYVVYTPYDSSPHIAYFTFAAPHVEPIGNSEVSTALQACASSPADYLVASDLPTLTNALQTFLKSALTSAATFTN